METGRRHLQKELELQPMPTTMQARATMKVLRAPAAGPGHGVRHRRAGAAVHGTPWTTCSHLMVHAGMQHVEGKAKYMIKAAEVKVDRCAPAEMLEDRTRDAQLVYTATATNLQCNEQSGRRLRLFATIADMMMNVGLVSSHALLPR